MAVMLQGLRDCLRTVCLLQVGTLPLFSHNYGSNVAVTVMTNGRGHFVLRNSSVQLTISDGRITSLYDVDLECVHKYAFCLMDSDRLVLVAN